MFSSLKKSKTLRSLLGAAALFAAGAPSVAESVPKPESKITQTVPDKCQLLAKEYRPLCEQLEGNFPYCYYGKTGKVTVGCGVHVKDFKDLQTLAVLKVTPKKGKTFSLDDKARLSQIANANWQNPETKKLFPEVEKVERVKVENCEGACPKSTAKTWKKSLFLMPTETLKKINESAIQFHVKNAYECHPNLFNLSPSLRLVVVDLIYNLGYEKYKTGFPKFQTAVQRNDLWQARKESSIKGNLRRTDAHTILIDSALLCETRCMKKSALKTFDELKRLVGKRKNGCMKPSCEGAFWRTMVDCTRKDHFWYQAQKQTHFLTKTIAKIK